MLIPSKPKHRRYAFHAINETQYKSYARGYSKAKAGGIRCVYAWASGTEVLGIVKNISKGVVIDYGKRKLAGVIVNCGVYIISPAVVVFTNATRIVDGAKRIHSVSAFIFECIEDTSNLAFVPLDFILFGQPIPIGNKNRFNLFLNNTDFLDL